MIKGDVMISKILIACVATAALQAQFFFSPEMISTHLRSYTSEEVAAIEKDKALVRDICFGNNPGAKERPVYLATAGAPGARKTTTLERFMQAHPEYSEAVYLDPDQRGLKFMTYTYISRSLSALMNSKQQNYGLVTKAAYDKWAPASNYITVSLLEEAFQNRHDVAHGTTATGEIMPKLLSKIKENGYEIVMLLCGCEDEFRSQSISYRNQEQRFYQSTPEDAVSKGIFFPQRMWAYFTYADQLYFYWNDALFEPEKLAAVIQNGALTVHDTQAWQKFVAKYEKDRAKLAVDGKLLPSWNELIELAVR